MTLIDSEHFSWDEDWESEKHDSEDYDWEAYHDNADEEKPSLWKVLFLGVLKAQYSITRLGAVLISAVQEMETLSVVAPQVKDIEIHHDLKLPVSLDCSSIYCQW
jgi:hypothetical protein